MRNFAVAFNIVAAPRPDAAKCAAPFLDPKITFECFLRIPIYILVYEYIYTTRHKSPSCLLVTVTVSGDLE